MLQAIIEGKNAISYWLVYSSSGLSYPIQPSSHNLIMTKQIVGLVEEEKHVAIAYRP